jgi:DHA3 family macrolide efflux protein-like MFS transporter
VATLTAVDIPAISREDKDKTNLLGEVKEGYGVMRSVPGMRELLVIGALYAVIYFSIGTLYPLITMSYFNGGVRESLVETVFAVGTLVGSVSLGIWGGRIDKIKAIAGSIGIYGAGTLVTGLLPPDGFYVFVFLSFFMGVSVPFYFGVQTSIYQIKIQGEYLGRALSLHQHGGNAPGTGAVRSPGRSAGNRELVSDIRRGNLGDCGVSLNSACFAALYGRMIPAKYFSGICLIFRGQA